MTWTAATTPDEVARQGTSLVASILRAQPASPEPATDCTSAEAARTVAAIHLAAARALSTQGDKGLVAPEPAAQEPPADQPKWMRDAIKRLRWRQHLRMNLPKDFDVDRFPDL